MSEKEEKKISRRTLENQASNDIYAEFLLSLHKEGHKLSQDQIAILEKNDLIDEGAEAYIQQDVDVIKKVKSQAGIGDRYSTVHRDISIHDWFPKSKTEHTDEFHRFINSINYDGFRNKTRYMPYLLYCQQAEQWLKEDKDMGNFETYDEKVEYAKEEFKRCQENSFYFLDKYVLIKEADIIDAENMSYTCKPVHKVIAFLFDCGYSMMIGKPRQIAATTTFGALGLKRIIYTRNFFLKFIAQDKDKGEEIFEDKIKYPFSQLPEWMKPEVSNDRENLFRLSKKEKKGTKKGVNSKLQVVAPSVPAVNGGAPPLVFIDEAGYISFLGKMIKEARPTMFRQNPKTKKLEVARQIVIWGTGGQMDKGGKSYEKEFFDALKKWGQKDYGYGIIPIFFDWTTRPGITDEFYAKEKRAYTVEGPDAEEKDIQFRQAYPSIIEDMFLTSSKTIVPSSYINKNLDRIRKMDPTLKPKKGYFEPIYDTTKPSNENDDAPFKIIGATFIPTEDIDKRASVEIFMDPDKKWKDRYYKGTDPISSDNGYSNMASVVYDAKYNTLAAIMNYRDSDHKNTFLQSMLLNLYYSRDGKTIPEVVESNIGTAYTDYCEYKGYERMFVYRSELPFSFQGGGELLGIDTKGKRKKLMVDKLYELITNYGHRFHHEVFFDQLLTFICTFTDKGNETWGTQDRRYFHDDVLDAAVFSYICRITFEEKKPKSLESEQGTYVTKYPVTIDKYGNLTRTEKRVRVNV